MRIDHAALRARFEAAREGRASPHAVSDRVAPSLWQFDHLVLHSLRQDIEALLRGVEAGPTRREALDVGSFRSPYKALLEARGYLVRTLDLTTEQGADFAGTAEATHRPDASCDLLVCTQVLEHVRAPFAAMREFHRIVRPGGHLLVTVPHVWFYHPHPGDYWRFTQEGLLTLCEDAGFRVQELRAQGGSTLALGQVMNFLGYGVLGRRGAPFYGMVNVLARLGDALVPNELFCLNMACLAQKPS